MTKRADRWRNVHGRGSNLRGPNRALSLDEQLEIQRRMKLAAAERRRVRTAASLATQYGVSNRTIYRYAQTIAVPPGFERLTIRIRTWAAERDLDLTLDDIASLVYLVSRHRDAQAERAS